MLSLILTLSKKTSPASIWILILIVAKISAHASDYKWFKNFKLFLLKSRLFAFLSNLSFFPPPTKSNPFGILTLSNCLKVNIFIWFFFKVFLLRFFKNFVTIWKQIFQVFIKTNFIFTFFRYFLLYCCTSKIIRYCRRR